MKNIQSQLHKLAFLVAFALGLLVLSPVLASAQVTIPTAVSASASASANTSTSGAGTSVTASAKLTAAETKAITRGDTEIDRRTAALTDLNTRIQAMQKVTDTFKAGISASITNEISTLAGLKAKIDADTDITTLKTDIQSITASYRVFALVLPQGRIAAAADREVTLVSMMSTLGTKLQARIQAAQQGGTDVTAMNASLTDMAAKLKDAQTQAEAAVTASSSLTPDGGDKTKMAANTTALKTARADLKAAQTDLVAARADVKTIITALGKVKTSTTASTTTTTTTTTQ
jgi:hypothetical protein